MLFHGFCSRAKLTHDIDGLFHGRRDVRPEPQPDDVHDHVPADAAAAVLPVPRGRDLQPHPRQRGVPSNFAKECQ